VINPVKSSIPKAKKDGNRLSQEEADVCKSGGSAVLFQGDEDIYQIIRNQLCAVPFVCSDMRFSGFVRGTS